MIKFIIWLLKTIWAETHATDPPSAAFSGGMPTEDALLDYLAHRARLLRLIPYPSLA